MAAETHSPATGSRTALVAIASLLAVLMLVKFVAIKPVAFLLLAVLFAAAALLNYRGAQAGRWLLAFLCLVTAVIFGAHLVDKGFAADAYQNNADYVVILLGFPLAVVGVVLSALSLRSA